MHFKTFYRLSLALPIIAPFSIMITGPNMITSWLALSLMFSGVEYLFFAAIAFYLIGRISSEIQLKRLYWLSPFIFVAIAVPSAYIQFLIEKMTNPDLKSGGLFILVAIFGILFGYGYCFVVEIIYQIFIRLGWITSLEAEAA